jgi:hypothetical protein
LFEDERVIVPNDWRRQLMKELFYFVPIFEKDPHPPLPSSPLAPLDFQMMNDHCYDCEIVFLFHPKTGQASPVTEHF